MYKSRLLSLEKKSYEEVYESFSKEYSKNLISFDTLIENKHLIIYDFWGVAVSLTKTTTKNELKYLGNISFIGTKELVNKTIKDIKSKGFSLEKIKEI